MQVDPNYAAQRLAIMIVASAKADGDPRTLDLWCKAAGISVRGLQYVCAAAGISPVASRDLSRIFRLVIRTVVEGHPWEPFARLDADPRTVTRLLDRAGLNGCPRDVPSFVSKQRFIEDPVIRGILCSSATGALAQSGLDHRASWKSPCA